MNMRSRNRADIESNLNKAVDMFAWVYKQEEDMVQIEKTTMILDAYREHFILPLHVHFGEYFWSGIETTDKLEPVTPEESSTSKTDQTDKTDEGSADDTASDVADSHSTNKKKNKKKKSGKKSSKKK